MRPDRVRASLGLALGGDGEGRSAHDEQHAGLAEVVQVEEAEALVGALEVRDRVGFRVSVRARARVGLAIG